jgi:hypothetical protein
MHKLDLKEFNPDYTGDKPAIDSVEAGIIVKNRTLSLEDSMLNWLKPN